MLIKTRHIYCFQLSRHEKKKLSDDLDKSINLSKSYWSSCREYQFNKICHNIVQYYLRKKSLVVIRYKRAKSAETMAW